MKSRLLVLWLLAERPMTGYEIVRSLRDAGWFTLEEPSIYSALRTLVRRGYAIEDQELGDTRRPRTRFALTPAGRSEYHRLLLESVATVPDTFAPIDVVLAARGDLDEADFAVALATRVARLEELLGQLPAAGCSAPSRDIVKRHEALLRAELSSATELLQPRQNLARSSQPQEGTYERSAADPADCERCRARRKPCGLDTARNR